MPTRKKPVFSVTKAVKSNARDRIGMPPPGHALPDDKSKADHRVAKHKVTLEKLLQDAKPESEDARPQGENQR